MEPSPDRRTEQPGDEPAGQDAERHGQRQREPALRRVEDRRRVGLVIREVVEHVADATADDRPRYRADDDERQVVQAEPRRWNVRADRRGDRRHPRRDHEPQEQHDRECDRLDPDGGRVAQLDDRVERERDDPERHGPKSSARG
jgi:hypothetical protein